MDTNKLKSYAQEARRDLRQQISSKLLRVLDNESLEARENPEAVKKLKEEIEKHSKEIVIEKVAYTWFNRVVALRYMDLNHYTKVGIVSPVAANILPEILADALEGHIDSDLVSPDRKSKIIGLLSGKIKSNNAQQEAYRIILASSCNYYHEMMPFLFEKIADYTELLLPSDLLSDNSFITKTRTALTIEECSEVEVIGWLYQFYISERKDEVMATKKAYKEEDIPAVTQLFTPNWIVRYMVENSLGRLWLENYPESTLKGEMDFYIEPETNSNHLKINSPEEISFIDPCCGSGHILVYAFELLTKMYEEQGYNKAEIPKLILAKNLYGIDIDKRAADLAYFALIMKARSYHNRFFHSKVVQPNILVMENSELSEQEITSFINALDDPNLNLKSASQRTISSVNLQDTIALLRNAETFGSLIQPQVANVEDIIEAVEKSGLDSNIIFTKIYEQLLTALNQIRYLQAKYHCVVTNPPYMGTKGMNITLKNFVGKNYKDSKSDLFACFMERCQDFIFKNGYMSMIVMQSWMFLSSYEQLRKKILNNMSLSTLLHLGYGALRIAFGTTAFIFKNEKNIKTQGCYFRLFDKIAQNTEENVLLTILKSSILDKSFKYDYSKYTTGNVNSSNSDGKQIFYSANQQEFKKIPGSPIAYWVSEKVRDIFANNPKLGEVGEAKQGLATADNNRFLRMWSEVSLARIGFGMANREEAQESRLKWFPYNKGGERRKWYGNQEYIVNWENDGEEIRNFDRAVIRNQQYYFRESISWSKVTSGKFSVRYIPTGCLFDVSGCSIFSDHNKELVLISILNSNLINSLLSSISPTLNYEVGHIKSLPIRTTDEETVSVINSLSKRCITISSQEWDSRETSWDFTQNEILRVKNEELKSKNDLTRQDNAVESSLRQNYNLWVKQARETFFQLHANEEELNRISLDIYDLADEMDKFVDLEDITLYKNEMSILTFAQARDQGIEFSADDVAEAELRQEKLVVFNRDELMKQFISYGVGCMFGRYTLDSPGLFIANQGQTIVEAMSEQGVESLTYPISESNVLPMLEGDWFSDDITERFKDFLKVTFGKESFEENLKFVESALGKSVEKYFLRDFYADHVRRYKKRPIYWLFSSPKGSFNALIYLHRYSKSTASVVLSDYLREFVLKLRNQQAYYEQISLDPSQAKPEISKAIREVEKLKKMIKELEDYERDVLHPLTTQQVELDLDDGVKVNYEKLGQALKKF